MPPSYMCKNCGEKFQASADLKQHLTDCKEEEEEEDNRINLTNGEISPIE